MPDVIVVGSGMGGLTCSSLLAQRGYRVLLLEKHKKLGGFTHTFKRAAKYKFDVGLHYVGDMGPQQPARRLMDQVTRGAVDWAPLPPTYDIFDYPSKRVSLKAGPLGVVRSLESSFPEQKEEIHRYWEAVHTVGRAMPLLSAPAFAPQGLAALARLIPHAGRRLAFQNTDSVLKTLIPHHPELRSAIASQWGNHGLSPSKSAFLIHCVIAQHYEQGGFYPVGGSDQIAAAVSKALEENGSEIRAGTEVSELWIEAGRCVGVQLASGERIRSRWVISNAGARNTYLKLLGPHCPPRIRAALERFPPGTGFITLFVGLSRSPAELGLQGENYWLFNGFDHDRILEEQDRLATDGHVGMAYVSFPSLKDPQAESHTAQIIAPISAVPFLPWKDQPVKRRDESYQALKKKIREALLAFVERRIPGFSSLIDTIDVSTPLTTAHYCSHVGGESYGLPPTPERFQLSWLGPRTPIPGLLLTGADAYMHGIVGALMGGAFSARHVAGMKLLAEIFR